MQGLSRIRLGYALNNVTTVAKSAWSGSRFTSIDLSNHQIFPNTINLTSSGTLISVTGLKQDINGKWLNGGTIVAPSSSLVNFAHSATGDRAINFPSYYYKSGISVVEKSLNMFKVGSANYVPPVPSPILDVVYDGNSLMNEGIINLGSFTQSSSQTITFTIYNVGDEELEILDIDVSSNLSIQRTPSSIIATLSSDTLVITINTSSTNTFNESIILDTTDGPFTIYVNYDVVSASMFILYVSPNGNNSNTGTSIELPLATIDKAFDIIAASSYRNGVSNYIYLKSGTNSPMANVRHVEYTTVVGLSGSRFVRGWNIINDPYHLQIQDCNFASTGLDDYGLKFYCTGVGYNASGTSFSITNTQFTDWTQFIFTSGNPFRSPPEASSYCLSYQIAPYSNGTGLVLGMTSISGASTSTRNVYLSVTNNSSPAYSYYWGSTGVIPTLFGSAINIQCSGIALVGDQLNILNQVFDSCYRT